MPIIGSSPLILMYLKRIYGSLVSFIHTNQVQQELKEKQKLVHSEACYDLHNNESTDFEYQDDLKKKGFHFFSWHFLWDPGSQITTVDATARDAEGHPLGYDVFETEITSSPSDAWQVSMQTSNCPHE